MLPFSGPQKNTSAACSAAVATATPSASMPAVFCSRLPAQGKSANQTSAEHTSQAGFLYQSRERRQDSSVARAQTEKLYVCCTPSTFVPCEIADTIQDIKMHNRHQQQQTSFKRKTLFLIKCAIKDHLFNLSSQAR